MKPISYHSRYTVLWAVALCYLIPFAGLSIYGAISPSIQKDGHFFQIGLASSALGSLALFCLLTRWDTKNRKIFIALQENAFKAERMHDPVILPKELETFSEHGKASEALDEALLEKKKIMDDMADLIDELQKEKLKNEQVQGELQIAHSESEAQKQMSQRHLEEYQTYIQELQKAHIEQKNLTEKKQHQIVLLETKVADLTYEIKTLLQLAEKHSESLSDDSEMFTEPPVLQKQEGLFDLQNEILIRTPVEAAQQLKKCIDWAQKITPSNRFNSSLSHYIDSPADNYALDLRRLCDILRNENNSAVLLYSPKENHLLFANNKIRSLIGWSPEKFIHNFHSIIEESLHDWREAISKLTMRHESTMQLTIKTKEGPLARVQGHLGLIPTGIFRNHAIVILYPSLENQALTANFFQNEMPG